MKVSKATAGSVGEYVWQGGDVVEVDENTGLALLAGNSDEFKHVPDSGDVVEVDDEPVDAGEAPVTRKSGRVVGKTPFEN